VLLTVSDDVELFDLLLDLPELIDRGLSDKEIARRLELDDPKAVAYFRSRREDFGSI
jgi:hypothetical protein